MNWIFGKKEKKEGETPKKKGVIREWVDAIVFAVVVATIVRWLIFTPYTIPTPSMEGTQLVGDFLIVSKLTYGAKTPKTPLQLPLISNFLWKGTPSYLDWIQLPVYRLPGFSEVKRNDVVVFHYPAEREYPSDGRTPYVKRCVAISGDTLMVKDKVLYINGEKAYAPEDLQFLYPITSDNIKDRVFEKHGISDYRATSDGYILFAQPEKVKELGNLPFVTDVQEDRRIEDKFDSQIYHLSKTFPWNRDFFGPLYIPKKGDKIELNERNLILYKDVIVHYDGNENVEEKEGKLFIDGKEINEYTFKLNYYFMMGDNRDNSLDSRYWGFVPSDHIIGKASFTFWSVDKKKSWLNPLEKVRWNRIFKKIE